MSTLTVVRTKFRISQKITTQQVSPSGTSTEVVTVIGEPVCPPSDRDGRRDGTHPNAAWWRYTPSGRVELGTVNPAAAAALVIGREYFVDFTPADPPGVE